MVVWGVDKLTDVEHARRVAESFYLGLGTGRAFLTVAGLLQVLLGFAVTVGWRRRWAWPAMALVNGVTLLAVWPSVLDPWGFFLEGGSLVFYSSTVIFAGILVGWAFMDADVLSVDVRGRSGTRARGGLG
jgi:uncharacterized membrane protein YphA (DoxX/SURF4 family)